MSLWMKFLVKVSEYRRSALAEAPSAPASQEEILTNRLAQAYRDIGTYWRLNNDYCRQLTALNKAHRKSLAIIRALRKQRKSEQVETRERLGNQIVTALDKVVCGADGTSRDVEYYRGVAFAARLVDTGTFVRYNTPTPQASDVPIGFQEFKADKFFVQFEGESIQETIENHFNGGCDSLESAIAEADLYGTEPYKIVDRWGQVLATGGK